MCDSMDLSPVSKLSCNFQDLYTTGDREAAMVRKSLFAPQSGSTTTASSPPAFGYASHSGFGELSSSASSIPTFKKPLGPSTKVTRAKKLQEKRKTGSYIARSSPNLGLALSSLPSNADKSTPAQLPVPVSPCEEGSPVKRASRAQSFCFGDRSPLSPLDLETDNLVQARDLSPYSGQRVGSCPTSRRASASTVPTKNTNTNTNIPTLRLPMDLMEDGSSSFEENKENLAPRHGGSSPYRPPSHQDLCSSPSSGRSRSGSMTDRSHLRRHNIALLASDEPYAVEGRASANQSSFRIHHRAPGLASSSSAVATSPFASSPSSSSSASVITSPFSSPAADVPAAVAGPSARRIKNRNCRSLTVSCGSLPTLSQFSPSPSSSLSSSTPSLPSPSMPLIREAHVPVLPTNPHASHSDLPCIEPTTLLRLLRGEFDGLFSRLFIIDCRFKYEYDGGHIRGALNLNTTQDVEKYFMLNPIPLREKVCIIFHCEFSSHRGPVLCRYLRSWDRKMHEHCYPELYYPEMYVLEGGYKKFWETPQAQAFCDPEAYVPMKDTKFLQEMKSGLASIRNFSAKKNNSSFRSRSWTVDSRDEEAMAKLRPVRFPRLAVSSPLATADSASDQTADYEE